MDKKQGLLGRLKKIKHIEIIIAIVAVAIMLIIYFVGINGNKASENAINSDSSIYSNYCVQMQSNVTEIVSNIQGAGKAKAVINWESGVELVLAESQSNSTNSNTSSPTIINNGGTSNPIIIKEIYPKAVGVVVICEGGGNAKVKVDIMMSLSILLGISTDKIVVLPMEKA